VPPAKLFVKEEFFCFPEKEAKSVSRRISSG
jgi:hypothetical protein